MKKSKHADDDSTSLGFLDRGRDGTAVEAEEKQGGTEASPGDEVVLHLALDVLLAGVVQAETEAVYDAAHADSERRNKGDSDGVVHLHEAARL